MQVLDDARSKMKYYFLSCTGATDESELNPIRRADNPIAEMVDGDGPVAEGATDQEQVQLLALIKGAPDKLKMGYDNLTKKTRGSGEQASLTGIGEEQADASGPLYDTDYGQGPSLLEYVKEGGNTIVSYGGSFLARIGVLSSSRGNQYEILPGDSRTPVANEQQITSGSGYQGSQMVQFSTSLPGETRESDASNADRVKVFTLE